MRASLTRLSKPAVTLHERGQHVRHERGASTVSPYARAEQLGVAVEVGLHRRRQAIVKRTTSVFGSGPSRSFAVMVHSSGRPRSDP